MHAEWKNLYNRIRDGQIMDGGWCHIRQILSVVVELRVIALDESQSYVIEF
jgi:hypothetical protein